MADSFKLKRNDIFLGKKLRFGESGKNSFVRIGQKTQEWMRPVHEVWNGASQQEELKNPLIHQSATSVGHFADKLNFYTTANAQYLFDTKTPVSWWHIIAYPVGKFVNNYIVKQGFRDGIEGFLHAVLMSFHSFLTRSKLWLLSHK